MTARPREVFQRIQQQWLGQPGALAGDDLTEDVVVEFPFAAPGRPQRFEGRQQFLDFANPQRAVLPVRFDACETRAIHETADGNTLVVEYELTGTSTKTNQQTTAAFVAVLTFREGRIAHWREYQNTLALAQALG